MKRFPLFMLFSGLLLFSSCDDQGDEANNLNNASNVNNTSSTNNTNNTNNTSNTNNTTTLNNLNNTTVITTAANRNKSAEDAMQKIFPGRTNELELLNEQEVYVARNAEGTIQGVGILTSHYGYNSSIGTMTCIDSAGSTLAVETISQYESWWSMVRESFFDQFDGILFDDVTLLPDYNQSCTPYCSEIYTAIGDVDAVSGATWTSDAIIKNVMDSYLIYDALTL